MRVFNSRNQGVFKVITFILVEMQIIMVDSFCRTAHQSPFFVKVDIFNFMGLRIMIINSTDHVSWQNIDFLV